MTRPTNSMPLRLLTCPQWHAKPPKTEPTWTPGRASRIIFHHTAGHHPEIAVPANESDAEAIEYAQQIQRAHMDVNGWIDSGHSFLVCRNGLVLQGRWRTVSAIKKRRMVVSAHCPFQNDQIGIEHEHVSGERITDAQREASAQLMAWIAGRYGLKTVLPVFPHHEFFPTACPDVLEAEIPRVTLMAQQFLTPHV